MMSFVTRVYRFLIGLVLYFVYAKRLDLNRVLKDKTVAIVGAANSTQGTGKGDYIDSHDFVIRINKAPTVLESGNYRQDIGSRIDILFHSFFESGDFGGGVLDIALYDRLGVRYLVNPQPGFLGLRVTLNFYKKYLHRMNVHILRSSSIAETLTAFGSLRPTTGFLALAHLLECECKQVYITGFTFFRTPYTAGYRQTLADVGQLRNTMSRMKIHDPDLEFREFIKALSKGRPSKVVLDPVLSALVDEERAKIV